MVKALIVAILLLTNRYWNTNQPASQGVTTANQYRILYERSMEAEIGEDQTEDFLNSLAVGLEKHDVHLQFDEVEACASLTIELPADVIACVYVRLSSPIPYAQPVFPQVSEVSSILIPRGPSIQGVETTINFLTFVITGCSEQMRRINEIALYEQQTGSDSFGANYYLGNCALVYGDYERALKHYTLRGSLRSSGGGHYYWWSAVNAAWIYLQLGNEGDAFDLMDATVQDTERYYPDEYPFILTKRSQLYALAFRFEEAIEDMTTAIEIAESDPATFTPEYLSSLYTERGQRVLLTYEWDEVLADYNRAIEIDPEYAPAYFHRGVLFYTQGPRENALPDFQMYLDLAPQGEFADEAAEYMAEIEAELAAADD